MEDEQLFQEDLLAFIDVLFRFMTLQKIYLDSCKRLMQYSFRHVPFHAIHSHSVKAIDKGSFLGRLQMYIFGAELDTHDCHRTLVTVRSLNRSSSWRVIRPVEAVHQENAGRPISKVKSEPASDTLLSDLCDFNRQLNGHAQYVLIAGGNLTGID